MDADGVILEGLLLISHHVNPFVTKRAIPDGIVSNRSCQILPRSVADSGFTFYINLRTCIAIAGDIGREPRPKNGISCDVI